MDEQLTASDWAQGAWPDRSWSGSRTLHGAFHQVVLTDEYAVRIARGANHRARVQREAHLLRAAGRMGLRYSVPLLLDGPVSWGDRTGFLTTVVAGESRESGHWPEVRDGLLAMLGELALVPPQNAVAPLVGQFSAAQLSRDFDHEMLRRAMVHRASLPRQIAAAAELTGDGALRDHALGNFADRALRGTLYDPGGASPT